MPLELALWSEPNCAPAVGFVQRDNVRLFRAAFSFNPRPRNFLNLQQMFHDFYYTQFTNLSNGQLESADFYMTLFDWHFRSGDNWSCRGSDLAEFCIEGAMARSAFGLVHGACWFFG